MFEWFFNARIPIINAYKPILTTLRDCIGICVIVTNKAQIKHYLVLDII